MPVKADANVNAADECECACACAYECECECECDACMNVNMNTEIRSPAKRSPKHSVDTRRNSIFQPKSTTGTAENSERRTSGHNPNNRYVYAHIFSLLSSFSNTFSRSVVPTKCSHLVCSSKLVTLYCALRGHLFYIHPE